MTVITSDTLEGRRKQISEFFNKLLNKSKAISIETLEGDRLVITKDETAFKANGAVEGAKILSDPAIRAFAEIKIKFNYDY